MKNLSPPLLIAVLIAALLGYFIGKSGTESNDPQASLETIASGSDAKTYTCPMHSGIVTEQQGSCPICGMDLVEKHSDHSSHENDDEFLSIKVSSQVQHNLGVRTAFVTKGNLKHTVETIGKITRIDPMARKRITPPIAGELVYLADKYDGDSVRQGEHLFSIISDKLIKMQQSFQASYKEGDNATVASMMPALRKAGLTPAEIADLQEGAEPAIPVKVYAPENGYIFTRRGQVGDKVPTGFTVFKIGGDYQVVEVTAEIFERDWSTVEEKQAATMSVRGLPGIEFAGEVIRVEPPVGYTTRSLEIRLTFKTNERRLSQSTFAHVSIAGKTRHNVLMVPVDAVIRTGYGDRVVVVRPNGVYQPLKVTVGEESDGMIEILSGLREGGKVVASGQFLIDSESNLATSFARMGEY